MTLLEGGPRVGGGIMSAVAAAVAVELAVAAVDIDCCASDDSN